jgi:hypothetical protein
MLLEPCDLSTATCVMVLAQQYTNCCIHQLCANSAYTGSCLAAKCQKDFIPCKTSSHQCCLGLWQCCEVDCGVSGGISVSRGMKPWTDRSLNRNPEPEMSAIGVEKSFDPANEPGIPRVSILVRFFYTFRVFTSTQSIHGLCIQFGSVQAT